jgi:hypothetical protein
LNAGSLIKAGIWHAHIYFKKKLTINYYLYIKFKLKKDLLVKFVNVVKNRVVKLVEINEEKFVVIEVIGDRDVEIGVVLKLVVRGVLGIIDCIVRKLVVWGLKAEIVVDTKVDLVVVELRDDCVLIIVDWVEFCCKFVEDSVFGWFLVDIVIVVKLRNIFVVGCCGAETLLSPVVAIIVTVVRIKVCVFEMLAVDGNLVVINETVVCDVNIAVVITVLLDVMVMVILGVNDVKVTVDFVVGMVLILLVWDNIVDEIVDCITVVIIRVEVVFSPVEIEVSRVLIWFEVVTKFVERLVRETVIADVVEVIISQLDPTFSSKHKHI